MLLEAATDFEDEEEVEDGRVTKELTQKKQLLNLIIFLMTLAGCGLCILSVSEESNAVQHGVLREDRMAEQSLFVHQRDHFDHLLHFRVLA
jgi:hypothetical protein